MAEYDSNPRHCAAFATTEDSQLHNWVKNRLKGTNTQVKDLQVDLADGVTLLKLLQCLVPNKEFPE